MRLWFSFFVVMAFVSQAYCPEKEGMGHVQEIISDQVYAGASRAKSGEPIYFGLERLNQEGLKKWKQFRTYHERGRTTPASLLLNYHPLPENYFKELGFASKEELQDTSAHLEKHKKKLLSRGRFKRIANVMDAMQGGVAGFNLSAGRDKDNNQIFVAYVSKKPIEGFFPHPKVADNNYYPTLKAYLDGYQDLVMVVRSVTNDSTPAMNNRGIFRLPLSLLEGTYRGVSLPLHGFTAAAFQKYFQKKYTTFEPLPTMYKIIQNALPEGALLEKGTPQFPPEADYFKGGVGILDKPAAVSTSVLADLYKKADQKTT